MMMPLGVVDRRSLQNFDAVGSSNICVIKTGPVIKTCCVIETCSDTFGGRIRRAKRC